jgi:ERCC4-related helicase
MTGVEMADEETEYFAKNWGIIADGTGLGKTLMITATIMCQDQSDDLKYMVIVVPPLVIYQWESVLERYGVLTSSSAMIENHSDLPKAIKEGV